MGQNGREQGNKDPPWETLNQAAVDILPSRKKLNKQINIQFIFKTLNHSWGGDEVIQISILPVNTI